MSTAKTSTGTQSAAASAAPSANSGQSGITGGGQRDQFSPAELAIVLSRFEIGGIESIQEFPRGSRRAPKLLVQCEKGTLLLKRRAKGKDNPFKVAFSHALQTYLAEQQFPIPHLLGTRKENNSMLQWKSSIYELFEYIKGTGYDNSLEATQDAGKTLALFHKLVREYEPEYEPPSGSYHAAKSVRSSFALVPGRLKKTDPAFGDYAPQCEQLGAFLQDSYDEAARNVNEMGLPEWPMQIIHCDWHPGNMLFRKTRVVAVIDFDAARLQQRIIDVANGALQFSIIGGGDDASQWPDYLDESRYKRFLRGYDSINQLTVSELRTIPWLMIEALVAESIIPVAATGSFARMEGFSFLQMIERKVRWLHSHFERLVAALD